MVKVITASISRIEHEGQKKAHIKKLNQTVTKIRNENLQANLDKIVCTLGIFIHDNVNGDLRKAIFEKFNKTVAEIRRKELLAVVNKKFARELAQLPGQQLYQPKEEDIIIEAYRARIRPAWQQGVTRSKVNAFRDYLRYILKWNIGTKRIIRVLFNNHQVMSYGQIPVSETDLKAEDELKTVEDKQKILPGRKDKDEQDEQDKQEARARKEAGQVARRIGLTKGFTQKGDDTARIEFHQNLDTKSFIRIRHQFNYVDATKPDVQPRHMADVYLTYRNTREPGDVPEKGGKPDDYVESQQIIDVSEPVWKPVLKTLFAHVLTATPNYFDALYGSMRSGNLLYLVTLHHNELPYCGNVFTLRKDMPTKYYNLRVAITNTPRIFVLVRGSDLPNILKSMMQDFKILAHFEPMLDFYKKPTQPFMNDKSVRPNDKCPRFVAPAKYVFETYKEFEQYTGLSALFEHRWRACQQTYTGTAAVFPVPGAYLHQIKLNLAYTLTLSLDNSCKRFPKLVSGDSVWVDFVQDETICGPAWRGQVTGSCLATQSGQITICVNRPLGDKEAVLDKVEHATITSQRLESMTPSQLQAWAHDNCNTKIRLLARNDVKEMRRIESNFNDMVIPRKLKEESTDKDVVLNTLQELMTCKDHSHLPASNLLQDIHPDQLGPAKALVYRMLRPYQVDIMKQWEQGHVFARNICLGGPSGGGKTYLIACVLLLHMLQIKAPLSDLQTADKEHDVAPTNVVPDKPSLSHPPVPPIPKKDKFFFEPGRVTFCAMQNETVDELFDKLSAMASAFAESLKIGPFLGIRLHSPTTEVNAVIAMIYPDFDDDKPDEAPYLLSGSERFKGLVNGSLYRNYIRQYQGSQYKDIRDARFRRIRGSLAHYTLELAQIIPPSRELQAVFSKKELEAIHKELKPLRDAEIDLIYEGGTMNSEIAGNIRNAARVAHRYLVMRASFIITPLAVATSSGFNIWRQSHVIAVEEAGRANGADAIGVPAKFWNAKLMAWVGDWRQLSPILFGPSLSNNFHAQGSVSFLARLWATGFHVPECNQTAHFKNATLLQLCQIVNDLPSLQAVEGSFDQHESKFASQVMTNVWGLPRHAVFIDVKDSLSRESATQSVYNVETAITLMNALVKRLQYVSGRTIAIMTPYKAQTELYEALIEHAILEAQKASQPETACRLSQVIVTTVDSMMGNQRPHIMFDMGESIGFIFDKQRFNVAATRATVSTEWYGDLLKFTSRGHVKIPRTHPFLKVKNRFKEDKAIITVDAPTRENYDQYGSVLHRLGIGRARR
ncbi:hypothetical protein BKA66DRAFT_520490 [Pyrenochaeta sp. MPI-SDFR-AT-0127]|nr:hypothetical protein BKA66DRAFT_520490 [Pyrenochaeta sp. MPI-SDFR-AT-0127]